MTESDAEFLNELRLICNEKKPHSTDIASIEACEFLRLLDLAERGAKVPDAVEAAAKICDKLGAEEQADYGLTRGAQNYFRARDIIRTALGDKT